LEDEGINKGNEEGPTNAISDRDGNKVTESRWKDYSEDLYDKSSKPSKM